MSNPRISTLQQLKQHSKAVGDYFFSKSANTTLRTVSIEGIYRQPYQAPSEGYVVTVNRPEGIEPYAFVYRFETEESAIRWYPIDRHESLASAEAFLRSMGAVK